MIRGRHASKLISVFSLVSLLGVAVAVAALIVVLSVMNGFDRDLKEKILGMKAHVMVSSAEGESLAESDEIEKTLLGYSGVLNVSPYITGQGMVLSRWGAQGVGVFGVNPARHGQVTELDRYVTHGSLKPLEEGAAAEGVPRDAVALGAELSGALGVKVGDQVTFFVPVLTPMPMGLFSKAVKCEVAAVFKSGMYEYDRNLLYTSLASAQKVFNMKQRVTHYALRLQDMDGAEKLSKRIRQDHSGWWAVDWSELNRNLFAALKMERYVMGLILILILLVASFTIIGTFTMLVVEKKREIGMLRAMGASAASLQRVFLWQGSFIGLVGMLLGSSVGLGLCAILTYTDMVVLPGDIYYLSHLPIQVSAWEVGAINALAVAVSMMATFIPAHRAAALDPVEAIRYE